MQKIERKLRFFFLIICACTSCGHLAKPQDPPHLTSLQQCIENETPFDPTSRYYLVILVDAKRFDYANFQTLCDSIAMQAQSGSYVGHAWVMLVGERRGQKIVIEGGHSGELGIGQDRYLEGVVKLAVSGDPNPIRYLHESLDDGFFQPGSGGHEPTFAARIELNQAQFEEIFAALQPLRYNFDLYSLTQNQCITLVTKIACLAGLHLQGEVTLTVPQYCWVGGSRLRLWQDRRYQAVTFSSPDRLEASLVEAVYQGKAKAAFKWYFQNK